MPNFRGFYFKTTNSLSILDPEISNIGYLEPLVFAGIKLFGGVHESGLELWVFLEVEIQVSGNNKRSK